jgi:hypothetical protein
MWLRTKSTPSLLDATRTLVLLAVVLQPQPSLAANELSAAGAISIEHAQLSDPGVPDAFAQVLATGDFDGDGFDDLAIGDPFDDTTYSNRGAVHVVHGSPGGIDPTTATTTRIGSLADIRFGAALAVGDFDCDGIDDLAIGLPGALVSSQIGAGAVRLQLSNNADVTVHQDSPGIAGAAETGDGFGEVLAAGDFDADGCDDLVLGLPFEDAGSPTQQINSGAVQVLPGSLTGPDASRDTLYVQGSNGLSALPDFDDRLGASLAVGDFDGDGDDDLAIGAPGEVVSGLAGAGALHILQGTGSGGVGSVLSTSGDTYWTKDTQGVLGPSEVNGGFGSRLAACDLSGDGRDDLAVGMPGVDDLGLENVGIVQTFLGSPAGLTVDGDDQFGQGFNVPGTASAFDQFGDSLACADFDGDGFGDLAIGAPLDEDVETPFSIPPKDGGRVDVLYGSSTGLGDERIQGWERAQIEAVPAPTNHDHWGTALAAGDFDGNGHPDLAVALVPEVNDGAVDVLFAGDTDLDQDGIPRSGELALLATDPADPDSDDDGFDDGEEQVAAADPNDPSSLPFFDGPSLLFAGAEQEPTDSAPNVTIDAAGGGAMVWEYAETKPGDALPSSSIALSYRFDQVWSLPTWPLDTRSVGPIEVAAALGPKAGNHDPQVAGDATGRCVIVFSSLVSEPTVFNVVAEITAIPTANGCDLDANPTTPIPVVRDILLPVAQSHEDPAIATDGAGNFLVVWQYGVEGADVEVASSNSSDGGFTWSAPVVITSNAADDLAPAISTDGLGRWVVAWSSADDLGGSAGADEDILFAVSTDLGSTWSSPGTLDPGADTDSLDDANVSLSFAAGTFLAVWNADDGAMAVDSQVFAASSSDGGATWTPPSVVDPGTSTTDVHPSVASDGLMAVAAWRSRSETPAFIGSDDDILTAISLDGGATWSPPASADLSSVGVGSASRRPWITTDGAGSWITAWDSSGSFGGLHYATAFEPDRDRDGLDEASETTSGTDPASRDTDGDGFADGAEVVSGSDPDSPSSTPLFLPPGVLNSNAASDVGADDTVRLATDGAGHWVAVWRSTDPLGASPDVVGKILLSRSSDDGATWSPLQVVEAQAGFASQQETDYYGPAAALDATGRCVIVYTSSGSTSTPSISSRAAAATYRSSMDFCQNLMPAQTLEAGVEASSPVTITTDGTGNFVAGWASTEPFVPNSNNIRARVVRSDDGFATTSPVTTLGLTPGYPFGNEVTTDGEGTWIAAMMTNVVDGDGFSSDFDIWYAVSIDDGATWTTPGPLHPSLETDTGDDLLPELASDGGGNWIAVWYSTDDLQDTIGADADILVSTSTDGGATWSAPAALNQNAATDTGEDTLPRIATDGFNWFVLWTTTEPVHPALGSDPDIVMARSNDLGATWSGPVSANSANLFENGQNTSADVATDRTGHWVTAWSSTNARGQTIGFDRDVLFATATGPDSDADGILDVREVFVIGTDPLLADSDGDGLDDGVEDVDQDGVVDPGETDPNLADTDGDGFSDGEEILAGSDPTDPASVPPAVPALPTPGVWLLAASLVAAARWRHRVGAKEEEE